MREHTNPYMTSACAVAGNTGETNMILNKKWLHKNGYTLLTSAAGDVIVEAIEGDHDLHHAVEHAIAEHCPDLHRDLIASLTYDAVRAVSAQQLLARLSKMPQDLVDQTRSAVNRHEVR